MKDDDPLDAVYAFVERAYIRLQAGDVLLRCLELGNPSPMQSMVEGLVLAGPQSIGVMREMLAESAQRKMQVMDDLQQVFSEFETNLKNYGVRLRGMKNALEVTQLTSARFLALLQEHGVGDEEVQAVCLQILQDSRDLMDSMKGHVKLLEDIETYLQDWLWGLAYQSARQEMNHI